MIPLKGVKKKRQSKTIWGGGAAALFGVGGFAAPFVSWIASGQAPADLTSLVQAGTSVVTAIGGIVAIVGRVTAKSRIG